MIMTQRTQAGGREDKFTEDSWHHKKRPEDGAKAEEVECGTGWRQMLHRSTLGGQTGRRLKCKKNVKNANIPVFFLVFLKNILEQRTSCFFLNKLVSPVNYKKEKKLQVSIQYFFLVWSHHCSLGRILSNSLSLAHTHTTKLWHL